MLSQIKIVALLESVNIIFIYICMKKLTVHEQPYAYIILFELTF